MRIFIIVIFLLLSFNIYAEKYIVEVIKVVDGDTVDVLTTDNKKIRLRLYGIDTPESNQPYGKVATNFLKSLILNKYVEIFIFGKGKYKRSIALIKYKDRIVNSLMISYSLAWVYEKYCKEDFCGDWRELQGMVRVSGKGIWSEKNPTPPWEWRKIKRTTLKKLMKKKSNSP